MVVMSLLNDRFTRGFIAGLIGCVPNIIFNHSVYYLKLSKLRYLDFASVFVYGHKPNGTLETLFAFIVALFFTSALGIVFVHLIPFFSNRNIVFKGMLFSAGTWFLLYAATILFSVPELEHTDLLTAVCNLIGAIIWGLALAYSLLWIDRKGKQKLFH